MKKREPFKFILGKKIINCPICGTPCEIKCEPTKEEADIEEYDPGPCYRCHQWPCCCKKGPLMIKPKNFKLVKKKYEKRKLK